MKCVISGNFMRGYEKIHETANMFRSAGVDVLSPRGRNIPSMEWQFEKLEATDFLYIVNPDGVIGSMTKLLMGYALAYKKPIYLSDEITDETLRRYVKGVMQPEKLAVSLMLARS